MFEIYVIWKVIYARSFSAQVIFRKTGNTLPGAYSTLEMPYISSYLQHFTMKFTEQALKSAQTIDFAQVSSL